MSHHSLKSSSHGYCEAIFSTSPRNSNKENTIPTIKTKKDLILSDEPSTSTKNQSTNKKTQCPMQKTSKHEITETLRPSNKSSSVQLSCVKPTNLVKQENAICNNITSNEKLKTRVRTRFVSSSNDKTSVTQFCTPKHSRITNTPGVNTKFNILPATRTPVKCYFSDHALLQSTPDCFNVVHLETPSHKIDDIIVGEQTMYDGESSNLTVGIRIRPLNSKELNDPKVTRVVQGNGQNVIVECESAQHTFLYDHCFVSYNDPLTPGHANQEIVFRNMVLPLVQNAFEGYNVCLFAYGQTGSGKSYSLMGIDSAHLSVTPFDEKVGIIPRFCQEIFTQAHENPQIITTVEISYFEIYNEKIHDLLASTNNGLKKAPLKVREHPVFGPYVVDLSQHCVQNYKDLQAWLKVGNSQRATAATGMNEKSSRSHSIFSIILTQTHSDNELDCKSLDANRRSKINLVDLAGSERLSQTSATGDRLREGVSINKSLLTLGKVIVSLTENTNNRKQGFVPYRESVLTWLLKESLGGNSRTAMLGTVSPANIHVEETLATLRYACQARAIVNRIRINEDPHDRVIRELQAEVQRLRGMREGYEKQIGVIPRRLVNCIEPMHQSDGKVKQKQKEIDKLKDQLKKTEEQLAATQISIENKGGKLILTPEMDGDTYVNGQIITGKIILKHGDRLVIGGNHYFKVLNPYDELCNVKLSTQAIDFEFAYQEILRVQEERLRAELEESKQKAIKELENAKREVELQLGSQKSAYEHKIEILGSTVEEQKHALQQINQQKKELELEKQLLVTEMETNNKIKKIQMEQSHARLSPYKSNFLQELENILNERTADIENALKTKLDQKAITAGGISLHEMQILVKEASQRCKEAGFNYEFDQQQIIVKKNLQSVIRVRDKTHTVETLWQPIDFLDWIYRLRNCDIEDSIKELRDLSCNWEPYDTTEIFEDSLNNSRISINMTPVKKQLNESIHQFTMDTSMLEPTLNDQISVMHDQQEDVNACLTQIEVAAKTLSKLCQYQNHNIKPIVESLTKMQDIIETLKSIFQNKDLSECEDTSTNSINSANNTVVDVTNGIKTIFQNRDINKCKEENTVSPDNVSNNVDKTSIAKSDVKKFLNHNMSPKKSSMQSNIVSDMKTENSPKNVRFIDKIEH
ncbi:kinesin-like protein KIF14 isoform X2 [Cataglyphis hispanica]|uniref:kinesin-like protein KIF14 isoform X2 n=1 Tax=Cataglyphis hispanica TaxID=1086592 RepID=UPI00217FBF83|nr:kinesin-like protein KIF14 isoform X2 [Cataglyphis hispanica]